LKKTLDFLKFICYDIDTIKKTGTLMKAKSKKQKRKLAEAGNKGRIEGLEYESLVIDRVNTTQKLPFCAVKVCRVQDIREGKYTTKAKPDCHILSEEGARITGVSIKNPRTRGVSIQMMIVSLSRFCSAMEYRGLPVPPQVRTCLSLFVGDGFKDFDSSVSKAGISEGTLDYDTEVRRSRCLWSSIPQRYRDSLWAFFGNYDVKKATMDIVLKQGMSSRDPAHNADWMLWSDGKHKSDLDNVCVYKTDALINAIALQVWNIRPSNSVLEIGPITLQMKGSGGKKTTSYHSLQFNASLSDIERYESLGLSIIRGNCPDVFAEMAEIG